MAEREPLGVIGAGWVGLVTATCFAELGHEVFCRDIVPEKVEALGRGEAPMFEPGLPELLERNLERLRFTTDMGEVLEGAQLLFCCVDTPPTYSGDADLSRVNQVVDELGDSTDHAIVMKSTVPVGTGRSVIRRSSELGYVANPEFLKEGSAVEDFMRPDRVVVGGEPGSEAFGDRVAALYEPLDAEVVRTDVASAEMIKLASNAFLATKISFINEIANVSEEVGADVAEVARGMGLDERIGPQFLRAGIGYGGSCLVGGETVLARRYGRATLTSLERLWETLERDGGAEEEDGVLDPGDLEVLSWAPGEDEPRFRPVMAVTRRPYDGEIVQVRTKIGRRVRCTTDHPWVVGDGDPGAEPRVKLARDLDERDWLPLAQGASSYEEPALGSVIGALEVASIEAERVKVRPRSDQLAAFAAMSARERSVGLEAPRGVGPRTGDIKRSGTLRLDELYRLGLRAEGSHMSTVRNGEYVASEIELDERFWRVVGLYLAEGHCTRERGRGSSVRERITWSFHPTREEHLVEEVASFWRRHGVRARVYTTPTSRTVSVSSRIAAGWWTKMLGLGRNCYEQRLPDLIWDQSPRRKRALLSGLWEGDGSWSLVQGGPSVTLDFGTVSGDLADGALRLLGDLGLVASQKIGRTSKSTKDTHWLTIAGADQIEQAIDLVPLADRAEVLASVARQAKRIAPTGSRRLGSGPAWIRVRSATRSTFSGHVYSLEVPGSHTFVTTGGFITHNCFPKDVSALKQLAGNSGYHFQLLTAVIEVNELQKRRTIGKLQKHLGSLVGKHVALLGLAFKPNTDDLREATSLVLAGRLQGEGADVHVYDPVAGERAAELLGGARVCDSALDALDGADAAVLVTEWPEFRELDWAGDAMRRMKTPLVVDGRNFLDGEALRAAGFTYEGVGR